jgi:hypothetical protein
LAAALAAAGAGGITPTPVPPTVTPTGGTTPVVTPTPIVGPGPQMAMFTVSMSPLLPHDFMNGGGPIGDVGGGGSYPIGEIVTGTYSLFRSDYRFIGWYDSSGSQTSASAVLPAEGLQITARFEYMGVTVFL